MYSGKIAVPPGGGGIVVVNTYAVYNRSLINVGFAELKGKPLNTSFLLAPFWLKAI
jgi:hypothetical protein